MLLYSDHFRKELKYVVTGISNIQGCHCGIHQGGMAITGCSSEGPVQGSDEGELPSPRLSG